MKQNDKIIKQNLNIASQDPAIWSNKWAGTTPKEDILKYDFYGGRHWIAKYIPRFGKTLEAGCGLGRYVFYFSKFGIDIEGLDFSDEVINYLNEWKLINGFQNLHFIKGDVRRLPFEDNSLSGYVSLGVIEHFEEGPSIPIAEAYRVLRPGGIAIITTPNKSFSVRYFNSHKMLKRIVKKLIGRPSGKFFQYEYTPRQLRKFVTTGGLKVTRSGGADMLYPFFELYKGSDKIQKGSFADRFSCRFESTKLNWYGAQSITISVKVAPLMHCFLSGELTATPDSLEKFDVPISRKFEESELARLYLRNRPVKYAEPYLFYPVLKAKEKRKSAISGRIFETDCIFGDFGLTENVHPDELATPEINIRLACEKIQPYWRATIE